ncbi:MAG: glucose-1-phosphate adenylyltransferase [Proteobacteria bacterium]|nr:glucose-1-phosphate adenylyltransferase [Pseudomonadota bacterium]
MNRVVAVILGGGRGSRLFPLTHERAKPAVPLFGKYRLIDVTISNCINSGINKVFVLTQFLSASLHRHIMMAYKFDSFSKGFVEILAAEQTERSQDWFMGTADAVRATLHHIRHFATEDTLILSGDHLYRMDYSKMIEHHRDMDAGLTLAVYLVNRDDASRMGLLRVDEQGYVVEFVEKPKDPEVIERFRAPEHLCRQVGLNPDDGWYLASMGVYVFKSKLLSDCLTSDSADDFGSQIIPSLIGKVKIATHLHEGYWADIGTISAFFQANIQATQVNPPFPLYCPGHPIFTHMRSLAPARVIRSAIRDSLVAEGTDLHGAIISDSVIGVRSIVRPGATLKEVVMFGSDYYEEENPHLLDDEEVASDIPLGIGRNVTIEHCIIDKNARIGDDVIIRRQPEGLNYDGEFYYVRDGITVIPRGAVVPPKSLI